LRALAILALLISSSAYADDLGPSADLAQPSDPDAPTVGASLDKSEAYVGDKLTLTVTAIAKAGIAVNLPQKLDLGKVELLERDDAEAGGRDLGDGRRSFRFVLYVADYEVGPTEIPSLELTYLSPRGEVRTVPTEPVALTIRALVDEAQTSAEPQPARGPRTALIEDRRVTRGLYAAAALVALGLLAFVVRRLWRRRARVAQEIIAPAVPARPPGEVAIERLTAIRQRGEFQRDGYRPFAFETAEVVRAYLGARYGFDSLELTSTELLHNLERFAPHLVQAGSEVVRFIEDTDLIKFANAGGSDAAALQLLDAAQAIVLATAPKLETAEEMLSGPVRPPMRVEDEP